jgi:hypothetical protein
MTLDLMSTIITRKSAKLAGLKKYFSGKPCTRGHVSERWVSVGTCVACSTEKYREWRESGKSAKWRKDNRDKLLAQQQGYRDERKEERAEKMREYYAQNVEARAAYQKRYLADNRAVVYARLHKRRARKLSATPSWFDELDELVMREAADLCMIRETATNCVWHIDHMVPLQARNACGLHWHANIQVIPQRLNASKSNRMLLTEPLEWLAHI